MNNALNGLKMLENVSVRVSVELGQTHMLLKDVLALAEDSVVALDRLTDELLDVMVNGEPIAKAEIITQDDKFALRIVELTSDQSTDRSSSRPSNRPSNHTPSRPANNAPGHAEGQKVDHVANMNPGNNQPDTEAAAPPPSGTEESL